MLDVTRYVCAKRTEKERLHPTQHSHRVTKTTVTSQRNTCGDARLELYNPLAQAGLGPSHSCAVSVHTDALVNTLSLRPIAFLSPFLFTDTISHSTHYTADYALTKF